MASDTSLIAEQGVATLPDAAWAQARQRAESSGRWQRLMWSGMKPPMPLLTRWACPGGRRTSGIRRARQGAGLVTDLARSRSGRRKGKGRLPESVERIIRELLQKRFLTKQKRSLAAFHREVAQAGSVAKIGGSQR